MTDTPRSRSNAISPVVFMGSGGPDTSPEAVERYLDMRHNHEADLIPVSAKALIRALSAALEAERESHTATLKDAQDECARAEAAETDRDALKAELADAVDTANQAIDVIASVQSYKQPDDPWTENALTMCEHEVFDFDVETARAFLARHQKGADT